MYVFTFCDECCCASYECTCHSYHLFVVISEDVLKSDSNAQTSGMVSMGRRERIILF